MEWLRREAPAASLAIFPGAFNPPTRAHLALAQAAFSHCGEVVFALPRAFPHKPYAGLSLDDRLALLTRAIETEPRYSLALFDGGLFIEMAKELRQADPRAQRVFLLCGRDAAERIVGWDYSNAPPITEQLMTYELLVAPRGGPYAPPPALGHRIHNLSLSADWDQVSSTLLRSALDEGSGWESLAPESLHDALAPRTLCDTPPDEPPLDGLP